MTGLALYAMGTMGLASPPAAPSSGISSIGLTMPAIFSVSPATLVSNGTFAVTLASQAANLVLASPSGAPGAPSFRSLVALDIPNLDAAKITTGQLSAARGGTGLDASAASNGQVLIGNGSGFALATITAGAGINVTNGAGSITITATGSGVGTVTSVGLSLPSIFSVSGSPVTSSGTLSATLASQSANLVFASPSGSAGAPTFRALVALDIPNLDTAKITTGQLGVARGGTGLDASAASNGQVLIGNGSGFALATITAGAGISVTNGAGTITITATGGGVGTVTSVGLSLPSIFSVSGSPVTTSGTLSASLASQSANLVFASPSGSAGAPTFRALVALDIPNLDTAKITTGQLGVARGGTGLDASAASNGQVLIGNGSGFALATITAGSGISVTNGAGTITITATGGGVGTVTSVGLSLPSIFSVSGSPVTTSGTLSATLASQSANLVFAAPDGSAGAPTFRALVALDIPNLDSAKITTGQLGVARGGTGLDASAASNGQVLIGNGSGFALATITAGAGISVTNGAGTITIASTITGTVTSVGLSLPSIFSVSGSPVTTSGTLSATLASQSANLVFASPSGSAGAPTFRALVALDIPNLDTAKITTGQLGVARGGTGLDASAASNGQVLIGNGSGFALATITAGAGISVTNGAGTITIASTITGTVTSVGLSLPAIFSVSGSPVTTSGTLSATLASQSANLVFASPSGSAGAPTFRALVALDIPNLDTAKITTGQLGVARGGTGLDASTATNGQLLIGNGSGLALATITAGSGISVTNGTGTITIAATGGGSTFLDNAFRIQDNTDNTKQIAFEASGITTATVRTITAPNRNLTLDTLVAGTSDASGFTANTVPYIDGSGKLNTSTQYRTDGSYAAIGHSGVNSNYSLFVAGSGAIGTIFAYTANTSRIPYNSEAAAASSTTVRVAAQFHTTFSGGLAAGGGTAIKLDIMDSSSNQRDAAQIAAVWQVASTGTRTADTVFYNVYSASALTERLRIGGDGQLTSTQETSTTSSTVTTLRSIINSSGTPAAGFGQRFIFAGKSSTTNSLDMAYIESTWHTATHASRQGRLRFYISVIGSMKQYLDLSAGAGITLGDPTTDNTVIIPTSGNTNFWIGTGGLIKLVDNSGIPNIDINHGSGTLKINGTQVVGPRVTGWSPWSGTANRSGFNTATATVTDCAQAIKAIIDDHFTHGLFGT